jgi:hypothetical protein
VKVVDVHVRDGDEPVLSLEGLFYYLTLTNGVKEGDRCRRVVGRGRTPAFFGEWCAGEKKYNYVPKKAVTMTLEQAKNVYISKQDAKRFGFEEEAESVSISQQDAEGDLS